MGSRRGKGEGWGVEGGGSGKEGSGVVGKAEGGLGS